jgi:Kef-type K+ transport system membrane component KefB/Trk K+ transport system NAD-binding subunit
MYGANLFSELSIVVAVGALVAGFMHYFKQPLIIGHILTGVIVGPTLLGVISNEGSFGVFGSIGVALLLFIIGLELNLKVFSKLGKVVFITTAFQVGVITLAGMALSTLIGFGGLESFIIGLSLALSSTIIIVKVLNDKKEVTRLYAQVAIGVLILQDVIATVGKIYLSAQSGDSSLFGIIFLLARGVVIIYGLYWLSRNILPKLIRELESSKELLLLFSLGWGLGLATLFEKTGFSIEVGALFAGISLAALPFSKEIGARLKPLRDFFIVIFFISLGNSLVPGELPGVLIPATLLSLVVLVIKPVSVLLSMGASGYTKRASFKTAVALGQVSEFSLVFLYSAVSYGLATEKAQSTVTLVALITFAASTYMMKYDDELFEKLESKLQFFERRITKLEKDYDIPTYPVILVGYRKGGAEFIRTFKKMKKRFVVVDYDPEVIEMLDRQNLNLLYGDVTDPEMTEELQLDKAKLIVSTISDFQTNEYLAQWLLGHNPNAVFICSAESADDAADLYSTGVAYVMMPHFIGSEKIGSFLQKSGLSKLEFRRFREKHLQHLEAYFEEERPKKRILDSSGLNPE